MLDLHFQIHPSPKLKKKSTYILKISLGSALIEGFETLRYAQWAHWAPTCHWHVGSTFSNPPFPKTKKEKHILKTFFKNQMEGFETL